MSALMALGACSAGSGPDDAAPLVSDVSSTVSDVTSTTTATADTEGLATAEPDDELPNYAELAAELQPAPAADAEAPDQKIDTPADIQLALADFSKRFGEVPGAVDFQVDDTFPGDAAPALETLQRNWETLTTDQQDAITGGLDELRSASTPIYSTADDPAFTAVVAELGGAPAPDAFEPLTPPASDPDGLVRPNGLRARPVSLAIPDNATLSRLASEAAVILQRTLGGEALRVELLNGPLNRAENGRTTTLRELEFPVGIVRNCTIWIFDNPVLSDSDYLISTIAHEVFHCWVHSNTADPGEVFRFAEYFDEGLATWVGEAIARGSRYGFDWKEVYLAGQTYPLYNESYSAHGFWTEIAQLRGNDAQLMGIIPQLVVGAQRGASNIFLVATAGLSDEQVALLAARSLNRAEFGPNWTMSGPNVPAAGRPTQEYSLVPLGLESTIASRGQQVVAEFRFDELPTEETWVITRRAAGLTHNRWANGDEFTTTSTVEDRFCLGDECVCPDGSPLPFEVIPLPGGSLSIHTALTGRADSSSTISMFATSLDDACDEEDDVPQPTGDQPIGLVGTWRASGEVVQQMFQEAYGDSLILTDVSGSIFLTLGADGGGSLKYDELTLLFGDVTPPVTISGGGTIDWNASDGELRFIGSDFVVKATSSAIGDIPLEISDEDVAGGGTTTFQVSVDDQTMTLLLPEGTRGDVFFPRRFIRQ